jgi:hypothetical protein
MQPVKSSKSISFTRDSDVVFVSRYGDLDSGYGLVNPDTGYGLGDPDAA